MKAPFIVAAALTFLVGAPFAHAFQAVQSNSVPAANASRVADPDDIRESMTDHGSINGSDVMPFGNLLRFGTSSTVGGRFDATSPFLENPANRVVPSQQR